MPMIGIEVWVICGCMDEVSQTKSEELHINMLTQAQTSREFFFHIIDDKYDTNHPVLSNTLSPKMIIQKLTSIILSV